MGQSKFRADEIARLKQNSPEETARWRQLQADRRLIKIGINPESSNIEVPAATTRALSALFAEARRTKNIDPPVQLLYQTVQATMQGLHDIPIACKKGCAHCCNIWVSASAPEALYIAKVIKRRGTTAISNVHAAHQNTKHYSFDERSEHPHPCPQLDAGLCTIYDDRPVVCRFATSADALVCERSYGNLTNEDIPVPLMYINGRSMYSIAMAAGLKHANLPHHTYEFNAALALALETEQAEQRWLAGDDIFSNIHRDPNDPLSDPQAMILYKHAFAVTSRP